MKNRFNINNPMAPLWLMYPHISRYSIGWRMGYGETYALEFGDWYCGLSTEKQKQFQQMFPEPKEWLGWYEKEFAEGCINDDVTFSDRENHEMKYCLQDIRRDFEEGKDIKYLFFSGHQPSKDGNIIKSCLSQWWKSNFTIDTDSYCCMEQYMMAEKAKLFNDTETMKKIMKSKLPMIMQELGQQVKNF